ncbi:MAG: hypothetical protein ACRDP6_23595 [Actinoallomurus sp.]
MNGDGSMDWRRHFAEILVSGDPRETEAAVAGAAEAERRGAGWAEAAKAGKAAARRYRGAGRPTMTARATASDPRTMAGGWPAQLIPRLFAPPARWGWETVAAAPVPAVAPPPPRPAAWVEPPRPDTSALHAARSKAVSRVVWRLAFLVVAAVAFSAYQLTIEKNVGELGDSAASVYRVALLVVAALLALSVIRAVGGVRYASRGLRTFEQPYLAFRQAERQRHQDAVWQWEQAVRLHDGAAAQAASEAARLAGGPQWFPVHPASEPARVDVFGGDPHRHGWASLLVTFGSALLTRGHRMTVLDFTGQEVGDNLVTMAHAAGMSTRSVRFGGAASTGVDLLGGAGSASRDVAECLGQALTGRPDGDRREERALVTDTLHRVAGCLDGPVTFARLAAGVRVLLRGAGDERLSSDEVSRLAVRIGEVDQNEWTIRQLRYVASRLDLLHDVAPAGGLPLWTRDMVSLISTEGGRNDRKELVDRLLVHLAQRAMDEPGRLGEVLVVCGADHLGAAAVHVLSEHARHTGVRLVLMIDQPQGDLEKSAGTGGVVCFMKLYNHRDASVAAEFIGREHRFVISQLTRQVGTTFTDGGGDGFAANTGSGGNQKQRRSGTPGRGVGLSDSRGHAWTGTRNWSAADNLSTSSASSRVHEFTVDPQQILGMPETAFILVDNTGHGRRVVLADCNPGLCLHPRVSAIPAS